MTRYHLLLKLVKWLLGGYVVDIFPIGFDNPVRIEFWGDTIDSIKYFDLDSQSSNKQIDKISIYPFTEFLVDNKNSIDSKLYKQKYLSNFSDIVYGIWNYLDNFTLIYYDYNQIISSYRFLRESIINYDNEISDNIKTNYMFDISDVKYDNIIYMLEFDNLIDLDVKCKHNFLSYNIDNYMGNFEKIKISIHKYISSGKTVIMCIDDKNVVKRIVTYLDILNDVIITNENEIVKNKVNIINKYIVNGFIYDDYVVISSNDLFGKVENKKKIKSKYKVGSKISNIDNLEKGDYIVHIDHGIGQYIEICTLIKNGLKKDYIKLLYADGDVLYLPVEKIDKITKFTGRDGAIVRLDKLGSDSWNKKKARVRSKLENIASDLIRVSAERENSVGYAFF